MFTANLIEFKTRQDELHKQAVHFRLVRSLEKPNPIFSQIINALGRKLIHSGQLMISRTQAAH